MGIVCSQDNLNNQHTLPCYLHNPTLPPPTFSMPSHIPHPKPVQQLPASKKQKREPAPVPVPSSVSQVLPTDLGKCIRDDCRALERMGWKNFVIAKRKRGDIGPLNFDHPGVRLLKNYKYDGVPVKLHTKPWSQARNRQALHRGPHRSCLDHLTFLQEEFVEMIQKDQWVILPYDVVKDLPGLRLSPPGCIPQRDRRPRWICDYSYYNVNQETVELFAAEAMQFGHALERILRQILLADPTLGPVKLIKVDIGDGFYRIALSIEDIPKLGVVFPTLPGQQRLVALPLVLPMGWKNSPPTFSTATETIADLANQRLQDPSHQPTQHPMSTLANTIEYQPPAGPTLNTINSQPVNHPSNTPTAIPSTVTPSSMSSLSLAGDTNPTIKPTAIPMTAPPSSLPTKVRTKQLLPNLQTPVGRDPSLPSLPLPGYMDVFVDDFITIAQGDDAHLEHVRNILMTAIDQVFRPCDAFDSPTRTEPISVKKLRKGDCSWHTIKIVLGWVIDTVALTIQLPQHRVERLATILASIPSTQKRIGIKKWHKVLGELRSMSIALPGARHLFSHMQLALSNRLGSRIALKKGVHQAVTDFKLLLNDVAIRPTRIAELIPLHASATGHHDASKQGAGGVWFPAAHIESRTSPIPSPIVWRVQWPKAIQDQLVTESNPLGTITNSDLELAGGLLHLQAIAQSCDVRERTILSKTDNLATLYWQRKGSATTEACPAHLLRLFGIHQRYHRYVPRHDYLSGPSNPLADASSRLFTLSNTEFLTQINSLYTQPTPFRLLIIEPKVTSCVISALLKRPCSPASLLVEPKQPKPHGLAGKGSVCFWPSIPFSKPSKVKYHSYRSLPNVFELEKLHQKDVPSALERLRITYGTLAKRSLVWGPTTHA